MINHDYDGNSSVDVNRFGKDAKKLYGDEGKGIYLITEVDAE